MAILKGKDGTVSIGGTAQGQVSSWSVSVEADTLETTAMGTGGWKTFVGSLQSWSGTIEMFATTTTAMASFITGADVVVVLVDTPSTGNTWTGTAVITSVSIDVSSADLVTLPLDLTGDGELVLS